MLRSRTYLFYIAYQIIINIKGFPFNMPFLLSYNNMSVQKWSLKLTFPNSHADLDCALNIISKETTPCDDEALIIHSNTQSNSIMRFLLQPLLTLFCHCNNYISLLYLTSNRISSWGNIPDVSLWKEAFDNNYLMYVTWQNTKKMFLFYWRM